MNGAMHRPGGPSGTRRVMRRQNPGAVGPRLPSSGPPGPQARASIQAQTATQTVVSEHELENTESGMKNEE
jgi:hypothetical protein